MDCYIQKNGWFISWKIPFMETLICKCGAFHKWGHPQNRWFIMEKPILPARDPKQCGGATGNEISGGDDDDDGTQMSAQRSRHMRAHMRAHR